MVTIECQNEDLGLTIKLKKQIESLVLFAGQEYLIHFLGGKKVILFSLGLIKINFLSS